jgi:hypothetical protein
MSGGTLTGSLLVAVAAGLAVHGLLTAHDHRRIAFAARSQVGLTSADEGSAQRPQIDRRLLIATVAAAAIGLLVGGPLGIIVAPFPYAVTRSLAARRQRHQNLRAETTLSRQGLHLAAQFVLSFDGFGDGAENLCERPSVMTMKTNR